MSRRRVCPNHELLVMYLNTREPCANPDDPILQLNAGKYSKEKKGGKVQGVQLKGGEEDVPN